MLSPDDIRGACQRKYPAFLRAAITGEAFFPLEIRFGRPSTTAAWQTLQTEISALAQPGAGYRIDWTDVNTRQWGRQRLPERVWFEHEADYLRLLGKIDEVSRFRLNVALIRDQCAALAPWLAPHAMRVIEHDDSWPRLLHVCRYFLGNPRPQRYARELPIPVGTKFIEENRPILRSLLDFILPTEHVDTSAEHFETRFGLRFDEGLVRFRLLDHALAKPLGLPITDLSVPYSQFRTLPWAQLSVLVVENKMTFLTLPPLPNTVAIWGGGNAVAVLGNARWLAECRVFYWGDLDVHGFHILSRFRQTLQHVESVLMCEKVLDEFASYQVRASPVSYEETTGLTPAELATYARLRDTHVLLEQEKIPHAYTMEELARLAGSPVAG